ncbi:ras-related protein Rab-13-like isoform X2 [Asterias amurensis]|uniref:ras-related protein Rab-13-like isoform X2 n=2 Tax=Asterias amurensis TaxID=7602 RepID=UPI003AB842E5
MRDLAVDIKCKLFRKASLICGSYNATRNLLHVLGTFLITQFRRGTVESMLIYITMIMNGVLARHTRDTYTGIPHKDHPYKILLVGGSSVGKTCILRRFVDGEFPCKCKATLGLDFKIRCVQVQDQLIKMQLWDTSGQERFRSMTQAYYRGAAGVMLVYDVTEGRTLEGLYGWLSDIKTYAPEDVDIILLGNKCDTVEQRMVSFEAGEEFARRHGLKFFETSAQDNTNISDAFESMAYLLANKVTETRKRVNSVAVTSPDSNGNPSKLRWKDGLKPNCSC